MNETKREHVYICDCPVLVHICSNGVFPVPKHPLGHTGDLGICAHIGGYQQLFPSPTNSIHHQPTLSITNQLWPTLVITDIADPTPIYVQA